MDDFHARALKSLRGRHENKIRQAAENVREIAGYVLRDLDAGRTGLRYATDIATDAQDIVRRLAALEAMGEAVSILETTDEPEGAAK